MLRDLPAMLTRMAPDAGLCFHTCWMTCIHVAVYRETLAHTALGVPLGGAQNVRHCASDAPVAQRAGPTAGCSSATFAKQHGFFSVFPG